MTHPETVHEAISAIEAKRREHIRPHASNSHVEAYFDGIEHGFALALDALGGATPIERDMHLIESMRTPNFDPYQTKIHSIKALREATGVGLKEAKDRVEAIHDAGAITWA